MTKHFNLTLIMSFLILCGGSLIANAESPTVIPNAPPLDRTKNFISNGSFEEPHLTGGFEFGPTLLTVDGDGYYFLLDIAEMTPHAVPEGWTASGGGPLTYARWGNNYLSTFTTPPITGQGFSDPNIDGDRSIYMGNNFIAEISEVPDYLPTGEVVFSEPPVIGFRPGYDAAVRMSQTISGLIPGATYRLSFWCSGEWAVGFPDLVRYDGFFGFEIEGYDIIYLVIPSGGTLAAPDKPHVFGDDTSHVYTLEFVAVDTDMDVSFFNYGHVGNENGHPNSRTIGWTEAGTPEVVIDDLIMNIVDAPRAVPTLSEWGLIIIVGLFAIIGVLVLRKRRHTAA